MVQVPTTEAVEAAAARVFAAPAFNWTPPSELESWATQLAGRVMRWLMAVEATHPWVFRALLIAIVAGLLAATGQAAWSAWRQFREQRLPASLRERRRVTRASARDAAALAAHADRLARDGRLPEAMLALWAALDLALRDAGVLQAGRTLTPRELARELGGASLPTLVAQLYGVAYRGDVITAAGWAAWRGGIQAAWPPAERVRRAA